MVLFIISNLSIVLFHESPLKDISEKKQGKLLLL